MPMRDQKTFKFREEERIAERHTQERHRHGHEGLRQQQERRDERDGFVENWGQGQVGILGLNRISGKLGTG